MVRLLIWATHLQTDILAVALHADSRPDVELLIVTPGAQTYLQQKIAKVAPFRARLLDRNDPDTWPQVLAFAADVVLVDNHIPPRGAAPRIVYQWHGLGWKAKNNLDRMVLHLQVGWLTGRFPGTAGSHFRAQCYGPTDLAHRTGQDGVHPDNCIITGMPFADLVSAGHYTREDLASQYRIDIRTRKTVLFCVSWHYPSLFPGQHSRQSTARELDVAAIRRTAALVAAKGANLLLCLHERRRYDPGFLARLAEIELAHDSLEIRFKDDHIDNLSDLVVADVMIANLSSFISYFYLFDKPAIHIPPVLSADEAPARNNLLLSRLRLVVKTPPRDAWVVSPHDTGGPAVFTEDDLQQAVARALDDPDFGRAQREAWLRKHLPDHGPGASARVVDAAIAMAKS